MMNRKRNSTASKKMCAYIHIGPFNSRCLFMDNPMNIIIKIITYLNRQNIQYK